MNKCSETKIIDTLWYLEDQKGLVVPQNNALITTGMNNSTADTPMLSLLSSINDTTYININSQKLVMTKKRKIRDIALKYGERENK